MDLLRLKTAFRSQILRESALLIRKLQGQVVDDWNLFESGTLKRSLQGHFSVTDIDTGAQMSMSYLDYARFLDMSDRRRKLKREGYHLYNRTIFGYLYRQTLPTIKYGFTEEVQQLMRNKMIETMSGSMGMESALILTDMSTSGDRNAMALVSKSLRRGFRY